MNSALPFVSGGLALTMALAAGTLKAAPVSGQVFTCVNAAGRTLTSDRLIGECMDREQRVLGRDGTLLRIVPPQLTAEERAEKEAREKRIAAEKQARLEAIRRDRNLLQRFPNQEAHDRAREAALEDMRAAIKLSELRQKELARERKPLLEEAEFYQGKPLPPKLKQQLEANEVATTAQAEVQVNQKAEIERVGRLYDAELARLRRLWSGGTPGTLGGPTEDPGDSATAVKPKTASTLGTRHRASSTP
jgi:hypothetical protein